MREAEQLASHDFVEAVDVGDAVTERGDGADFVDLNPFEVTPFMIYLSRADGRSREQDPAPDK